MVPCLAGAEVLSVEGVVEEGPQPEARNRVMTQAIQPVVDESFKNVGTIDFMKDIFVERMVPSNPSDRGQLVAACLSAACIQGVEWGLWPEAISSGKCSLDLCRIQTQSPVLT